MLPCPARVAPPACPGKVSPMPADPGSPAVHAAAGPGPENDADALIGAPLPAIQERARHVRDSHHGNRITFSPKVFIPLTCLLYTSDAADEEASVDLGGRRL